MTLTVDQWRLLLAAECKACKLCGGTGERDLVQRGKRSRTGRYVGQSVRRVRPCVRCKRWRQLLDVLARAHEAVAA